VAVGEAGERVVLGHPGIEQLALVLGGYVLGAAAIAVELAGPVELGMARDRPPGVPFLEPRAIGDHPHDQVVDLTARIELEVERTVALLVGIVGVGLEQRDERLGEQLVARLAELFGSVLGQVDQAAISVGGPDPADPGLFEVVEDLQPAARVAGRDDRRVAAFGRTSGRVRPAARQALEDPPYSHLLPVAVERPAPLPILCAGRGLLCPNAGD